MSGIVGIVYLDGRPADRAVLNRMDASIAHRGPHAEGMWIENQVGLGHRMLRTTPESLTENMPLEDAAAGLVLVADARIDNRAELIHTLDLRRAPEQISDGELILAAYRRWGEACPQRLIGDFAFAIWDARSQRLFCARDHFGVRPFFYHWSPGRVFIFGSEIKAVLSVDEVPRRVNEDKVADFWIGPIDEVDNTFFQDVDRLLGGHSLIVSSSGLHHQQYYALDPTYELRLSSDEQYSEAFREVLTEAVRCRLRSAVPVASFLSGGIDSSSVTCVARDLVAADGRGPLTTFSAVFDQVTQCDERPFIEAVLSRGGFEPHYVPADMLSALGVVERVLRGQDEVVWGGATFVTSALFQQAQQHGAGVILDGHDGDGVLSHAWGYLSELAYTGRWLTLAREMRAFGRLQGWPYQPVLWEYLRKYGLTPMLERAGLYRPALRLWRLRNAGRNFVTGQRSRPPVPSDEVPSTPSWRAHLNANFVERLNMDERYGRLGEGLPIGVRQDREGHYRILKQPLRTLSLEELDREAVTHAIEVRHPFFDKRVVEFCLALPASQKRRHGYDRYIARSALAGILPEEVRWRPRKAEFSPALSQALLEVDRERLGELLADDVEAEHRYLDMDAVRASYGRLASDNPRGVSLELAGFWKAMRLALWLRLCRPNIPDAAKEAQLPAA